MKLFRLLAFVIFLSVNQVAFSQFDTPVTIPGRPCPYFKYFSSEFVVKGEIVDAEIFKAYPDFNTYSITIKVLDDFGRDLSDTITLYPDTVQYDEGHYYSWIYELNNPSREKEFYCDFFINDDNQKCYNSFFILVDNKVLGLFTGFQFTVAKLFYINKDGIKPSRFERRVKHLLEKQNNVKKNAIKSREIPHNITEFQYPKTTEFGSEKVT